MQLYADTIFTGGRVYTAQPGGPSWAEAVAVRDGRILAVGSAARSLSCGDPRRRWLTSLASCCCPASQRVTCTLSNLLSVPPR